MEDIITDMRNSLADSINAARFNDAMSAQDALIESQGLTTRAAIDAQTSIIQSETANTRLNQTLMFYGSGGYGKVGKKEIPFIACLAVFFIVCIIITLMMY